MVACVDGDGSDVGRKIRNCIGFWIGLDPAQPKEQFQADFRANVVDVVPKTGKARQDDAPHNRLRVRFHQVAESSLLRARIIGL